MVLEADVRKRLEQAIFDVGPNKVVLNGMLAWLDAVDDSLVREGIIKIMNNCYSDSEVLDAKEILKNVVKANMEKFREDKDVEKYMRGHKEPNRKDKEIADIVDLNARLDGAGLLPTFLMTSSDFKRNPQLESPDETMGNVSHKVNTLERCIINLADKVADNNRDLKEELRKMKPSFVDAVKNRENVNAKNTENREDKTREKIRDRIDSASKRSRVEEENEDTEEVFENQPRRGFLGKNGKVNKTQDNQSERRPSWRNNLPNCVGSGQDARFAAPVDLFVFNVSKEASGDDIVKHMKDTKNLNILECSKVSHEDARTQSFRIKIKAADYEAALLAETWPYRVRVRVYRHFRQKREDGGQFGQSQARSNNTA